MERIKCAAVNYELHSEPGVAKFMVGETHSYCNSNFVFEGVPTPDVRYKQTGYITTYGRFVDCVEAYRIAQDAGQLLRHKRYAQLSDDNIRLCGYCRHTEQQSIDGKVHCDCFIDFYYDPFYNKQAMVQQ